VEQLQQCPNHKIPHIGFNKTLFKPANKGARIFNGLESGAIFYFVHSYRVCCDDRADVAAETEYGETFV
jgi:glutamine amidotransferase